jgi:membrane-associated phospholipid phosphatase
VLRWLALSTVAYLAITLVPMVRYSVNARDAVPLVAHLLALAIAWATVRARMPVLRPLRDWLPLALGAFLYIELRWLIAGVGMPHADATVIGWERALFPTDPSRTLALRFPGAALSESLHACYLAYYALVFVPPAVLYLRGRRDAYTVTTLSIVLAFLASFVVFMVFPVDGPRFLVGAAAAPAGPIRSATLWLLESASSRGTAFPSSHVAASVAAAICALRFQRPAGYLVAVVAVGLTVGTVYGGFHYAVDAVAGLVVGVAAAVAAQLLWRARPEVAPS